MPLNRTELMKALTVYSDLEPVVVNVGRKPVRINTVTRARNTICIELDALQLMDVLDNLVEERTGKANPRPPTAR